MSTWVVIPAYDEATVIGGVIADVATYFGNIVVVDDCSRDGTGEIALSAGAFVCRHPVNLGQGAALQTGIDFALSRGAATIATFDADGQHRAEDAARMYDVLATGELDIVLGSRFLGSAEGMPPLRGPLLRAAAAYTRLATGLDLTDTHNGLRVMTRHAAKTIRLRQNRMAHASEFLEQVAANRLRYREVPVTILYTGYSRAKGQRAAGALSVLADLHVRKLYR